ncbi:hypothetical protein VTH82DRAFT_2214 [Thermothelomyces myriococcoides]
MNFFGTFAGAALLNVNIWLLSFLGVIVSALAIPIALLLRPPRRVFWRDRTPSPPTTRSPYQTLPQHDEMVVVLAAAAAGSMMAEESLVGTESPKKQGPLAWRMLCLAGTEVSRSIQLLAALFQDPLTRLTLLVYLCNETAIYVRVTFPQWAVARFGWSLARVNALLSLSILVNGTVLLCLPYFSKGVLRRRAGDSQDRVDFWITRGSLSCLLVGIVLIAISPWGVLYAASVVLYSFSPGPSDALRSFVTGAMDDDTEAVQRLYMGISMMETIAALGGTTLWSSIFAVGVRKGGAASGNISFFASAGLFALSLWLVHRLAGFVGKRKAAHNLGG